MSSSDDNINIDELIEDLQSLNATTSATKSSKQNSQKYDGNFRNSPGFFPHPPTKNKSPTQYNPKAKFAVLPEDVSTHQTTRKDGENDVDDGNLDELIDMLAFDSPNSLKSSNNQSTISRNSFINSHTAASNVKPDHFASSSGALSNNYNKSNSVKSTKSLPGIDLAGGIQGSGMHTIANDSWDLEETNINKVRNANQFNISNKSSNAVSTSAIVPKVRCTKVLVGGPRLPRGLHNSAFSKVACDQLLCSQCNFRIITFFHYEWDTNVEYMFFRNNMPNIEKLSEKLRRDDNSVAYCCQCHWISEKHDKILNMNQMNNSDPKWICTGHAVS